MDRRAEATRLYKDLIAGTMGKVKTPSIWAIIYRQLLAGNEHGAHEWIRAYHRRVRVYARRYVAGQAYSI